MQTKEKKQRGATRGQLEYRRKMLLNGAKCIACGRTIGEHTEQSLMDCHRRKRPLRSILPLVAMAVAASVSCG